MEPGKLGPYSSLLSPLECGSDENIQFADEERLLRDL